MNIINWLIRTWQRIAYEQRDFIIITTWKMIVESDGGNLLTPIVPSSTVAFWDSHTISTYDVGSPVIVSIRCNATKSTLESAGYIVLASLEQPMDGVSSQQEVSVVIDALTSYGITPTTEQLLAVVGATRLQAVTYLVQELRKL